MTLYPIHYLSRVYTPSDVTPDEQSCDIYMPDAPMPRLGYPVLVIVRLSGWTVSNKHALPLAEDLLLFENRLATTCLQNGIAVIYAKITTADSAVTGAGAQHPPPEPQYYDNTRPMAIKDVGYLIQWIRQNGQKYGIDGEEIVLLSGSAGAHTCQTVAVGPDRQAPGDGNPWILGDPATDPQYGRSSRPMAFINVNGPWSLKAFQQATVTGKGVASEADDDVPATVLADAKSGYQERLSALNYAVPTPHIPMLIASNEAYELSDWGTPGSPPEDVISMEVHASDQQVFWKLLYPSVPFVIFSSTSGVAPDWSNGFEDEALTDTDGDQDSPWITRLFEFIQQVVGVQIVANVPFQQPVPPRAEGPVSEKTVVLNSNTEWTQLFAENPNRKRGVYVMNRSGQVTTDQQAIRVTTDNTEPVVNGLYLSAVNQPAAVAGEKPKFDHEIPGTSAVYAILTTATSTGLVYAYEY